MDEVTGLLAVAGAAVGDLVTAAQSDGLGALSHDEMAGLVRAVRGLQARLEFVGLAAVAEVDARGSYTQDAALTAGAWLRATARLAPHEAAGAVRTARALGSGELPGTAAALAAGQIDAGHVRVIADAVADAPAGAAELIEPEALAVARATDPRVLAGVMRRFRHALDPDGADAAALARYARRGLTVSPLPDGLVHLAGLADEVTGSVLATAIDAASPLVPGDRRTAAQRRLDGLGEICRAYLGSPEAPRSAGGHPQVIVTLDEATLRDQHPQLADLLDHAAANGSASDEPVVDKRDGCGARSGGPGGMLSWVGPIAGSTARRVACDADVTMVVIDAYGRVVAEQRQRRFFTAAQRRAMIARDGDRCPVPFCDRPIAWSDGHHLQSWARGGPTTVANGALPCAGHHTVLHEGGWTLHRLPDGRYYLLDPDGRTIGPETHPPGHHRPTPHPRH